MQCAMHCSPRMKDFVSIGAGKDGHVAPEDGGQPQLNFTVCLDISEKHWRACRNDKYCTVRSDRGEGKFCRSVDNCRNMRAWGDYDILVTKSNAFPWWDSWSVLNSKAVNATPFNVSYAMYPENSSSGFGPFKRTTNFPTCWAPAANLTPSLLSAALIVAAFAYLL